MLEYSPELKHWNMEDVEHIKSYQKHYIDKPTYIWVIDMFNENPEYTLEKYNYFLKEFQKYKVKEDTGEYIDFWSAPKYLIKEYQEFCNHNVVPEFQQLEMLDYVDKNMVTSIKSGKGLGKTTSLAWLSLKWITVNFGKVYGSGSTFNNFKITYLKECKKWIKKSLMLQLLLNPMKERIAIKEPSYEDLVAIECMSARDLEGMQGLHDDNIMMICDEASVLTEAFFVVMEGVLTSCDPALGRNAKIVLTGNPIRLSGEFYNSFHKNKEFYATFTMDGEYSANVGRAFVHKTEKRYGRNSNVFFTQVKGKFPKESSDIIMPYDIVSAAKYTLVKTYNDFGEMGVDVAGAGEDASTIAIRYGSLLDYLRKEQQLKPEELSELVVKLLVKRQDIAVVRIDSGGIGYAVVEAVKRLISEEIQSCKKKISELQNQVQNREINSKTEMHILKNIVKYLSEVKVMGINNGSKAIEDRIYQHLAAESWYYIAKEFENQNITFGDNIEDHLIDELINQLSTRKATEESTKPFRRSIQQKKLYRKLHGFSPDLADATILAYYDKGSTNNRIFHFKQRAESEYENGENIFGVKEYDGIKIRNLGRREYI